MKNATAADRFPAVESDTFILIPQTILDLDDFAGNHDRYLVSIYAEPERAAALWVERLKQNPYGSEGFVALSYYGHDLISADLWDETAGIWSGLVEVIDGFLRMGAGEALFPGQPVPISMRTQGSVAVFSVNEQRAVVDASEFVAGVLAEAERFYRWTEEHVGADESVVLQKIAALRAAER